MQKAIHLNTLIAQLQHIVHCSLGTTYQRSIQKQFTRFKSLGVQGLIQRLGDRSSNPLTYGSYESFGYDRDYEPRHVVGICLRF